MGKVLKVLQVTDTGDIVSEYSKQIPEDPFNKAYDHTGIVKPSYNLDRLMDLAEQHPTHSAILEQKAADIVGTGWEWTTGDEDQETEKTGRDKLNTWFEGLADDGETDNTTHDILLGAVDDMETFGQGFIELARDPSGKLVHWFTTPSHTMRFHKDGLKILQKQGNGQVWFKRYIPGDDKVVDASTGQVGVKGEIQNPANELLVLKRRARRSSYYGVPKYLSATGWMALSIAARDDNLLFFQNRREPRWVIILEGIDEDADLEEVIRDAFRHDLKDPHKNIVLPLSGGAKATFQKLGTDKNDASWDQLQSKVDETILLAHRMPGERVGFVRSGPLGGNAVTAATSVYKEGFVATSQQLIGSRINRMIQEEYGETPWQWTPTELDLEEEAAKERGAVALFQGGLTTVDEGRESVGKDNIGDDRGDKFFWEVSKAPAPGGLPADQGQLADQNDQLTSRIDELIGNSGTGVE